MFQNVLIFLICTYPWVALCKEVDVQTHLGKIRGIIQQSRKGSDYYSFRGVRYAEPPTGENRFRPAIPVKLWNGTMDATKDGFICPQALISNSLISEDCLILNVYTKSLEGVLPVLFYIHGGYFATGGIHSEIFWNPRYLMDKEVVVVLINYRVGPFGFLCTESEDAPGNLGLKDQVLALQWVRDNIKYFGGDPNRVTICGNSAGSVAVSLHMVSPMSQGLFHGAIPMSATGTSHVVVKNKKLTKILAKSLNCPTDNPKLLVRCLRGFPWEKLINSYSEVLTWCYEVEKDFSQEQFVGEHPTILVAQGKFAKVPVLVGITKHEYETMIYAQFNHTNKFDELNNDFYGKAPEILLYDPAFTAVTKSLRWAYLKNESITNTNLESYARLESDAIIVHGVHRFVNLVRKYVDVFYYRFDYQGRYSWDYDSNRKPYGVSHGDDVLYLFICKNKAPLFTENDPENVMVETLTTLWTTFVQTGNPNNYTDPWTSSIKWEPSNRHQLKMLYINEESSLGSAPYQTRMKLWDNLFPVLNKQEDGFCHVNQMGCCGNKNMALSFSEDKC